jgi:lipopolysaccharide biosynthesis glycosyltransferase
MLAPALFVACATRKGSHRSEAFDVIVFVGPDDAEPGDRTWAAERGIEISDGLDLSQIADIPLQQARLSTMTLARLLLPEHLAGRYDRILYLDADVIVEGDVGRAFALDTGPSVLAAVPAGRFWEGSMARRDASLSHFRALGMTEPFRYFNYGVLCIDVDKWNREDVGERSLDFLRRSPGLCILPDEDALNAVLDGRVAELSPIWNMRARAWADREVRSYARPVIIHFDGPFKPWHETARTGQPEFARIYRAYQRFLANSPWPDWLSEASFPFDGTDASFSAQDNRAYADAFIRFSSEHAFADVGQGIVVRDKGRMQLAGQSIDVSPGAINEAHRLPL